MQVVAQQMYDDVLIPDLQLASWSSIVRGAHKEEQTELQATGIYQDSERAAARPSLGFRTYLPCTCDLSSGQLIMRFPI